MQTASWVIVRKADGKPVLETFSKVRADSINRDLYRVVPILEWLQSLNNPLAPD